MTETINKLMEANLLGVFNERDAQRRAATIQSTYAADVRWTDDEGLAVGREALEAKAIALQSQMQGLVFTKAIVYQTRGLATWRGSSGLTAATPWPADSTSRSCGTTLSPSSIRSSLRRRSGAPRRAET